MADDGVRAQKWAEDLERVRAELDLWHGTYVEPIAPVGYPEPDPLGLRPRGGGWLAPKEPTRPLNLAVNLVPGHRREPIDVAAPVAPSIIAPEIDAAIGERAATDYLNLVREFQKHFDMLDAYLMAPSPTDELQPRITAASGLLSAMDAHVDAVARAGAQAIGDARAVMLRFCVKHELRRSVLMHLAARASDAAQEPRHLFITGEYER